MTIREQAAPVAAIIAKLGYGESMALPLNEVTLAAIRQADWNVSKGIGVFNTRGDGQGNLIIKRRDARGTF